MDATYNTTHNQSHGTTDDKNFLGRGPREDSRGDNVILNFLLYFRYNVVSYTMSLYDIFIHAFHYKQHDIVVCMIGHAILSQVPNTRVRSHALGSDNNIISTCAWQARGCVS